MQKSKRRLEFLLRMAESASVGHDELKKGNKKMIKNLVIGYEKAVEMGIEKEIEEIFYKVVPLEMIEKDEVISEWKVKSGVKVVLMSASAGVYEAKVIEIINKIYYN